MKYSKKHITATVIILVICIVFAFTYRITFSIDLTGKLVPEKEWLLRKWQDGTLIIEEQDYRLGQLKKLNTFQPQRGDLVEFRPVDHEGTFLHARDTIGFLYSNETMREMNALMRELNLAKSELAIRRSGEKEALVARAEEQLQHAQERFEIQNRILKRKKELYDAHLIAEEEYEIAGSTADMLQLEIRMAESNFQAVKAGAKPEEILRYQTEIEDLEEQITLLEQRLQQFIFLAPFDGDIFHVYSKDTLFLLGDTSRIVLLPVNMTTIGEINPGQAVEVIDNVTKTVITGKIERINNIVQYINRSATQVAIIQMSAEARDLPANILVQCRVLKGKVSLMAYLKQQIQNYLK